MRFKRTGIKKKKKKKTETSVANIFEVINQIGNIRILLFSLLSFFCWRIFFWNIRNARNHLDYSESRG